mgnify:FL=1
MESSISVIKHIFRILSSDKTLNEMVGNKIFPIIAENDITFPFILVTRTSTTPITFKTGVAVDKVTFQVVIEDVDYFRTVNIAERVRELLELRHSDYFKRIEFSNCYEDFMNDAYQQKLQFSAMI